MNLLTTLMVVILNNSKSVQHDSKLRPVLDCTVFDRVTQCALYALNAERGKFQSELKELEQSPVCEQLFGHISARTLCSSKYATHYRSISREYRDRLKYLARIADLELTISILTDRINALSIITESEIATAEMKDNPAVDATTTENLEDLQGANQDEIQDIMSDYVDYGQTNMLDVSGFFARPMQIADGNFALGTTTQVDLKVWDLYTLNPAVRAKLRNYAFFRGNLHVRIALTGTPFHYGKILVSYQPFIERNDVYSYYDSQGIGGEPRLNYLSQTREASVMDIRENQPLELVLPYICHKPLLRLFNSTSTAISDVTSFEDIEDLGTLILRTINDPACVNPDGSDIRYYVFAWMEDLELGAPTGTHLAIRTESEIATTEAIQTESGTELKDERETGPIERFSSGAKEVSDSLSTVPFLAPFAVPSSIIFGALKSVASLFGWSKPRVDKVPNFVKNLPFQNGANTLGYDTAHRITLDPKQELMVSGRPTQDKKDEMTISFISSRASYLTSFTWAAADVPMTNIWSSFVTPNLVTQIDMIGQIWTQPTAMAYAVQPFNSWRGDVEFTFEFVCSQYHRGKMLIVFDPNMGQEALITTNLDLNKQYAKVIDLQEVQTITFCVQWAYHRSWARVQRNENFQAYSSSPLLQAPTNADWNCYNGMITVAPFTSLTSPDDGDISVNVYVKCKNLQVNRFTEAQIGKTRIVTESEIDSSFIVTEAEIDEMALSSQPTSCHVINESSADSQIISSEHYGERPVSFRALLKRFTEVGENGNTAQAGPLTSLVRVFYSGIIMPRFTAFGTAGTTQGLFDYLRPAYVGIRGSIRKRFLFASQKRNCVNGPAYVRLLADASTNLLPTMSASTITTLAGYGPSCDGGVTFTQDSNAGVEAEFPYYSRNLFSFSFSSDDVGSNPGGDLNMDTTWARNYDYSTFVEFTRDAVTDPAAIEILNASGEDFMLFRYQGAPPYII